MEHPPTPTPEALSRNETAASLAERLRLAEQWTSQVRILNENGFLSIIPETHDFGYKDAEGNIYPVPTDRDIAEMMKNPEQREFLEKKREQGFTRLLLVPEKLPLASFIKNYGEAIARHRKKGALLLSDGTKVTEPPYENREVYVWDEYKDADTNGKLVYAPQEFSPQHGGLAKATLTSGWRVLLTEDLQNLQREGQGATKGGRKQLETNKTPNEYLTLLKTEQYKGERGYDPETYMIDAITRLEETNTVTDDDTYSYLTGAYFLSAGPVPGASWARDYRQAALDRREPGYRRGYYGVRVSVGVEKT